MCGGTGQLAPLLRIIFKWLWRALFQPNPAAFIGRVALLFQRLLEAFVLREAPSSVSRSCRPMAAALSSFLTRDDIRSILQFSSFAEQHLPVLRSVVSVCHSFFLSVRLSLHPICFLFNQGRLKPVSALTPFEATPLKRSLTNLSTISKWVRHHSSLLKLLTACRKSALSS